ncbi:protease inhibitor I42 family protein [Streptomyces alboniger]|uniref:Proteinase inhibitor I42 chagasin domain-containing protein n=1 Tax=Streptomyces alboniger TaxID=132473 RepID=A0A5J6H935_STRAD|nr:protease inhibitor I42 family protein [Streptomyces alboniger]QEV16596.1 hypothetical protein CP975_02950 [Streptomyces alboniger]
MADADITLTPGERREIRLPALGTAGFTWTWRLDGDTDSVAIAQGRPPAGELHDSPPGASADILFTLTALRPGHATLQLDHRRPWEQDTPPKERRCYEITVESPRLRA